jgi:hypothetical protein
MKPGLRAPILKGARAKSATVASREGCAGRCAAIVESLREELGVRRSLARSRSDDFEQEEDDDDEKDSRDAAAAVVSDARAHAVTTKAEDENEDDEKDEHATTPFHEF